MGQTAVANTARRPCTNLSDQNMIYITPYQCYAALTEGEDIWLLFTLDRTSADW